ncbi:monooxygenase FAD-binding protein [Mycolicibacterium mageritense DSM 44476 = CIP 104973]|uniref:FAD-dependent oxidoreductase n=1 Tax=Mycolicibacterium mageritense TaxID=53462 RepID=A0ABM7HRH4_MYCME|nr:NAD(P)/FAD-dependent oxidoreductase [Mycolicibacterium mageritense]BBX33148.1 FAD-dependent oxidoreductase [Mycolicibacterium mageritense]CDO21582.1 flavin-dependent dehydrogenase [Mycolicibacterium mageritense DSM 44476 = CIP 104973]
MQTFDVVIVGARCAGSPLAVMLARRGLNVCVVDKARFPSETPSTHVIQPCGVSILEGIGALDAVLSAGAVPIDHFTLVNEDVRIDAEIDPAVLPRPGLCVRRLTLDALLVETAAAAGADVRTGVKATGVLTAGDRVVGVQTEQGPIRASLVIGADGRHSRVATAVGAREYLVTPGGRIPAWAYFEGVADREGRLRLARLGKDAYLACPTDSGLYMACIATGAGLPANRDAAFSAAIAGWPELADLIAGARRVGPIRVMTKWHGYFRQAAGPGWVLIGDGGHFKDFTPAQGIADALRQAQRLAETLPSDLANHQAVDATTQRWWRWRDHDAHPMYWFATDMGGPGPSTPLITQVLRDIATDSDATQTLLQVLNHDVAPARLLTPRRLAVAAARTLRDHPDLFGATSKEIAVALRDQIRRARLSRKPPSGMTRGRHTRRAQHKGFAANT